jgi:A118 family predicted phage portal protein
MNIWNMIIEWVKKLFGVDPLMTGDQSKQNNAYTSSYEDTETVNLTAIFANKLSAFVASESMANVIPLDDGPETARVQLLDEVLQRLWIKSRKFTARLLGVGGIVIIPYVTNGRIYFDVVAQDRISINKMRGDQVIGATVLADLVVHNYRRYYRWIDYQLEGTTHVIRNKATSADGVVPLTFIPEWAGIQEEIRIGNVDRLLFAFIKSPVDNRQTHDLYGVPVTFGCEKIIAEIQETLQQINQEYALKKSFVGVDERLFSKDNRLPVSGLFKFLTGATDDNLWEIYDPAIRDSSYYNRLENLFVLLEKQVGVSRGILTKPESRGATATEIKAGLYDTYSLVEAVRDSIERGMDDFIYACNVLANAYSLTSASEYDIRIDWSYALIESSSETFAQYLQGEAVGAIETAEIRQYLMTDETLDDARQRVDEILERKRKISTGLLNASLIDDSQGMND